MLDKVFFDLGIWSIEDGRSVKMVKTVGRAMIMQQITVEVPDEIAMRLASRPNELPQILALGLREINANLSQGFSGLSEVLEFLVKQPQPQEILALRLSPEVQSEVDLLLEKSRSVGLSALEECLWQQYEYVEHLVRMAKAQALLKLKSAA